jgi:hypothetical protein
VIINRMYANHLGEDFYLEAQTSRQTTFVTNSTHSKNICCTVHDIVIYNYICLCVCRIFYMISNCFHSENGLFSLLVPWAISYGNHAFKKLASETRWGIAYEPIMLVSADATATCIHLNLYLYMYI